MPDKKVEEDELWEAVFFVRGTNYVSQHDN
jgi:hypothetical protein